MFKLYQSRSKFTVKVTCLKSIVLLERYGHKEHNYANMNTQSLTVRKSWPMFKNRLKVTVKVTRSKFVIIRNALSKGTHLPNMKALSLRIKKLWLMTKFLEVDQRSRSRLHVQNLLYRRKGLVIMNTHAKYESPISKDKKVMTNLKVFQK